MNVADSHVLSDLSPDGIVYINTDKEVGYINPAFLEMTGFSQDELLNLKANILGERILSLCNDEVNTHSVTLALLNIQKSCTGIRPVIN